MVKPKKPGKPVKKDTPTTVELLVPVVARNVGELMREMQTVRDHFRGRVVQDRQLTDNLRHIVDQMGRALSEQVHILAKELPANRHQALALQIEMLTRRVALLEKETTWILTRGRAEMPAEAPLTKEEADDTV